MQSEIRTIKVTGQSVRVALYGSAGAARTLLVFNGIGASLETVAPFATQFRETRVVIHDMTFIPTPAGWRGHWPTWRRQRPRSDAASSTVAPASRAMGALVSPVKAPSFSKWMFCTPRRMSDRSARASRRPNRRSACTSGITH